MTVNDIKDAADLDPKHKNSLRAHRTREGKHPAIAWKLQRPAALIG